MKKKILTQSLKIKLIEFLKNINYFVKIKMSTLFDKVGGHDNLTRIVAQFYQHILADDRINYFFLENVSDIVKLHTTM